MGKMELDIGDPISAFENDNGVVEIHREGNGIFLIFPTTGEIIEDDCGCYQQIAQALSWWREKTKQKIVSTAVFYGRESAVPTLLVVTETKKKR